MTDSQPSDRSNFNQILFKSISLASSFTIHILISKLFTKWYKHTALTVGVIISFQFTYWRLLCGSLFFSHSQSISNSLTQSQPLFGMVWYDLLVYKLSSSEIHDSFSGSWDCFLNSTGRTKRDGPIRIQNLTQSC